MNRASLEVGELVHIPASVYLLRLDPAAPQVTRDALVNPEPVLGVVTNTKHADYVEVYCRGGRWSVPHRKIYKL